MERPTRPAPTFLFGVLVVPFGVVVGYSQTALEPILTHICRHESVARAATLSAIALFPHGIKLFWAPLLDRGAFRRHWYMAMLAATVATFFAAIVIGPAHLGVYIALLTAANLFVATSSSAVGALMATTVPEDHKGRAGGWNMAGNLAATGVFGGLALYLQSRTSPVALAAVLCAVCLASGAFVAAVAESRPPRQHVLRAFLDMLGVVLVLLLPLRRLLRLGARSTRADWRTYVGLIICLSPVGAGAALLVLPGIGGDWHASDTFVAAINGPLAAVVAAPGALLGGIVADRMNRSFAYGIGGALTAAVGVLFAIAPMTGFTFAWGCTAYAFMNGIAYGAFAALALELTGTQGAVAAKYSVYISAANQAITYMQILDGHAHDWWGARGMLWFDAACTLAGCALIGVLTVVLRTIGGGRAEAAAGMSPRSAMGGDAPTA